MINPATYYSVSCDEPGCGVTAHDLGSEFAAWADAGLAVDDWISIGCQETPDGKHYCEGHRKPQCDDCEVLAPVNDDGLCESCSDEGDDA